MRNTDRRPRTIGDLGIRLIILVLGRPAADGSAAFRQPAPRDQRDHAADLAGPTECHRRHRKRRQLCRFAAAACARSQRDAAALGVRNLQLQAEINTLKEVEIENEQLRSMFDFAQTRPRLELRGAQIVARVIGEESTNFLESILIDLGRDHGIEVGMPVVTDEGLVGRISDVTDTTAKCSC